MTSWTKSCLSTPALALAIAAAVLAGCAEEELPPVAAVSAQPAELTLEFGRVVPVTLEWRMTAPLREGAEPMVFVHLLADDGEVLLTADHPFPGEWRVGETVTDELRLYHSALAPPLPAGEHRLTVGLYEPGGDRWNLDAGSPAVARAEYPVATVAVPAERPALPRYAFTGDWSPVGLGEDRQIRARRWLAAAGAFTVEEVPGPGEVWLEVLIPEAAEGWQRIFDDPDADEQPAVRVIPGCGAEERAVAGVGRHAVSVPLDPAAGSCEIRLEANYQLVELESFQKSVLSLEQLAWLPAG